jgi:hypothetical protein
MTRDDENKLIELVTRIDERVNNLPCRQTGGCGWSLRQKAIVGTGLAGTAAAIVMQVLEKVGVK